MGDVVSLDGQREKIKNLKADDLVDYMADVLALGGEWECPMCEGNAFHLSKSGIITCWNLKCMNIMQHLSVIEDSEFTITFDPDFE